MKVLIIANPFPKPNNKTMCPYMLDQTKALKENNCDVLVISPSISIKNNVLWKILYKIIPARVQEKLLRITDIPETFILDGVEVKTIPSFYALSTKIIYSHPQIAYKIYEMCFDKNAMAIINKFMPDHIYAMGPLIRR